MHYQFVNSPLDQEPIDMALVYQHLRVSAPGEEPFAPADDELIKMYLNMAIDYVETKTGLPMTLKTGKMHYDSLDSYGLLLRFPTNATAPTAITYRDSDNVLQTYNVANAYINNVRIPNEVILKEDLPEGSHSIIISYSVTAVTEPMFPIGLQAVVLLLTAHYYDKRAPEQYGQFMQQIDNILKPYIQKWHG